MEEFDYLNIPKPESSEEVWCTIGESGELDVFNWDFVEKQAAVYDKHPGNLPRDNVQIICKLAVLIRKQGVAGARRSLAQPLGHCP